MERWEKINAVQHMQDYIEEHVEDFISLRMLADVANYSPWYSARILRSLPERPHLNISGIYGCPKLH